ncbi:MAG: response regulator [Planctomycetota bacterium]
MTMPKSLSFWSTFLLGTGDSRPKRHQAPEVILLDYMLPDVNGNVVCQTIRKNPEFENIKIIIVSGVVKQDEIEQLLKSGAEDFIRKPFDVAELTGKITAVLQMR